MATALQKKQAALKAQQGGSRLSDKDVAAANKMFPGYTPPVMKTPTPTSKQFWDYDRKEHTKMLNELKDPAWKGPVQKWDKKK